MDGVFASKCTVLDDSVFTVLGHVMAGYWVVVEKRATYAAPTIVMSSCGVTNFVGHVLAASSVSPLYRAYMQSTLSSLSGLTGVLRRTGRNTSQS